MGACWQGGADILIEDQYILARHCADAGIKVLLLDSPWNREVALPENIARVRNWGEIVRRVKEFTR